MHIREDLSQLAIALSYVDYAETREKPFGHTPTIKAETILRRGIGDLDFDPMFYLGTQQTSPEGWATAKK